MKKRYEDSLLEKLDELFQVASALPELRYVVNRSWADRVRNVITKWGPERRFDDGAYNFFRILTDHRLPIPAPSITPRELDRRLQAIASLARSQRRNADYPKTRGELASKQNNQMLAALFETNILVRLIEAIPNGVELFPRVGPGHQNVEARVNIRGQWIYVEAKAIGYSKFDFRGPVGSVSIPSMKQQVREALDSKLGEGSQLRLVPPSTRSVLCLALGFHADYISAGWEIDDFLSQDTSHVSCIFLSESAHINLGMRPFTNLRSSVPLTDKEYGIFKLAFDVDRYFSARTDELAGANQDV